MLKQFRYKHSRVPVLLNCQQPELEAAIAVFFCSGRADRTAVHRALILTQKYNISGIQYFLEIIFPVRKTNKKVVIQGQTAAFPMKPENHVFDLLLKNTYMKNRKVLHYIRC